MAALAWPVLCLVTDRRRLPASGTGWKALLDAIDAAVAGGANMVQVREKDLPAAELYALARRITELVRGRAMVIVNDRVDVALAAGADGVQLGETALPVEAARTVCRERLLIGRSVHSARGAVEACRAGADFLVAGPVYPTPSHPGASGAGPGLIRQVAEAAGRPVLGIGGVTPDNAAEVMAAGARGVAVIGALLLSPDPAATATALRRAIDAGKVSRSRRWRAGGNR